MNSFVYFIKNDNRVVITSTEIMDDQYVLLFRSIGNLSNDNCKLFCMGVKLGSTIGSVNGKEIINNIEEFK